MLKLTLQAFAEKWAGAALSERAASYQQHFLDLCAMLQLAHRTPDEEVLTNLLALNLEQR